MTYFTESEIEQVAIELSREENGYTLLYSPDLAEGAHIDTYGEVRLALFSDMLPPELIIGI